MANQTGYLVDVMTYDKDALMEFLRSAEGITDVYDGGVYHEDNNWSRVYLMALDAVWTLGQLDDLLYWGNHDIAGIVKA
ncbi:hypothetical protein [Aeromonas phage vB_ AhaP_PT2]|uniref:Uncharacterized protein n=1 Tax=Aeromonas phage vB_ AhaP_PT2 TaxID=2924715 RepID=A0AC61TT76_9CAUD|nr:hypothetical protein [Aeromonas phage vB_ AhaP_PT2]